MASKGFIELLRLADLARARIEGRDSHTKQAKWSGIVFEIAGQRLVAPIGEVSEVLAMPQVITEVPLSKSWMVGVANVRGRLLPLTDLAEFLEVKLASSDNSQRKVMAIQHDDLLSGIIVDRILGIEQFSLKQYVAESLPDDSAFRPYNHGKFEAQGQSWYVFMPSLLMHDIRYLEAAV